MRLFYALWPDDAVRERLAALQAHVRGKPTRYDNLHITLAFLGEQSEDLLPELRTLLELLPRDPVDLVLDRMGYFPRNRIAWAGMHDLPLPLRDLHGALTGLLERHDIAFDRGARFRPHVTLARDADPPPDIDFEPIPWAARRIVLVQSSMQGDGVRYRVLAEQAPRVHDPYGN